MFTFPCQISLAISNNHARYAIDICNRFNVPLETLKTARTSTGLNFYRAKFATQELYLKTIHLINVVEAPFF